MVAPKERARKERDQKERNEKAEAKLLKTQNELLQEHGVMQSEAKEFEEQGLFEPGSAKTIMANLTAGNYVLSWRWDYRYFEC